MGIGINGLTAPKVLGGIPTTCLADHVKDPDLEQIVARVARKLLRVIGEGVDRSATIAYCQTHSMLLGKEVTMLYDGSRITGYAVDISDCGELVVDTGNQTVLVSSAASNVRLK